MRGVWWLLERERVGIVFEGMSRQARTRLIYVNAMLMGI